MTRDELFRTLRGYFNYAADGGDLNVVLGTMTDLYMEAMQTSHSEMLWTELYDSQKEVLDDLRTNPVYLSEIQVQTVESNFDGYKSFQRASFGKIRFVKNHDGNHATLDAPKKRLQFKNLHAIINPQNIWACSSVGRAFGSHPRGRGFESLQVHQKQSAAVAVLFAFWWNPIRRIGM